MARDRVARLTQILVGIPLAQLLRLVDGESRGHIAVQRIVRRRLIGNEVELLAPLHECRHDFGGVAEQAHGVFFDDTATSEIYTLSLHDALPISLALVV